MTLVLISKSKEFIHAKGKLGGDHRKIFDDIESAVGAVRAIYAGTDEVSFPTAFPTVAAGIGLIDVTATETQTDADGNEVVVYADSIPPLETWPEQYLTAGVRICVSLLGQRGLDSTDAQGKAIKVDGARGLVVFPVHPLDSVRAVETGEAWLWKIVEKETSHVALRGLRNVAPALGTDALALAAKQMPLTVDDYVEESVSEGTDTAAFDSLWKEFRKRMASSQHTAAMVSQLPAKSEVIKAIRSAAYARDEYNNLESIGAFKWMAESMIGIIEGFRAAATEAGQDYELDSSEMKAWVAGRDTKVFPAPRKVESDLSTVNLSAFDAFLGTAPQMPAAPAGSTAGQPATPPAS